jgi:tetratricopeptide (TPR) repeat protein
LLRCAEERASRREWAEALSFFSAAIQSNPLVEEPYLGRAYCLRRLNRLDAALSDYDKVIQISSQNERAWIDRGACRVLKAYEIDDREVESQGRQREGKYGPEALEWFRKALVDYQKAAQLRHSYSAGLSVLELEVILDRYRQATATAAVWWNQSMDPEHKMVCGWLGAIAAALAGKRLHHWQPYREYLIQETARPAWEPEQIEGYLDRLEREGSCAPDRLAVALEIHQLFLAHFAQ